MLVGRPEVVRAAANMPKLPKREPSADGVIAHGLLPSARTVNTHSERTTTNGAEESLLPGLCSEVLRRVDSASVAPLIVLALPRLSM